MRITFEFSDEELSGDAKAMLAAFLGVEAPKAPTKRGGGRRKAADKQTEAPGAPEIPPTPPPGDDEDFAPPAEATAPAPTHPPLAALQAALRDCAGSYGSDPAQVAEGRRAAVGVLEALGVKKASALPEEKRAEAIEKLKAATRS